MLPTSFCETSSGSGFHDQPSVGSGEHNFLETCALQRNCHTPFGLKRFDASVREFDSPATQVQEQPVCNHVEAKCHHGGTRKSRAKFLQGNSQVMETHEECALRSQDPSNLS